MRDDAHEVQRERELVEQLRSMADRIHELDREGRLLSTIPELLRRLGDLRTQLFQYEVRCTYDTPEFTRSRRVASEARRRAEELIQELQDEEKN